MKDRTVSLRVSSDWWQAVKTAAEEMTQQMGVPISANLLVELSVIEYLAANGKDELATMAKGLSE